MRRAIVLAAAVACGAMTLSATPSSAVQRVANPSDATTLVTRTADMDKKSVRGDRPRQQVRVRGGADYWHYRLEGARWMSYQVTNAGYPARRYEGEVYYTAFPGNACCGYRRHWRWIGRYEHGVRYWPWMGHRRHHHHW